MKLLYRCAFVAAGMIFHLWRSMRAIAAARTGDEAIRSFTVVSAVKTAVKGRGDVYAHDIIFRGG